MPFQILNRRPSSGRARSLAVLLAAGAAAAATAAPFPAVAAAAPYRPGRILIGVAGTRMGAAPDGPPAARNSASRTLATLLPGARARSGPAPGEQLVELPRGVSVRAAVARLRGRAGIRYAVPDFLAHADGLYVPDDRGISGRGWQAAQWNLLPVTGVNAPQAWTNLIALGHPGGRGVTIAVLDTGVAYRNWHRFRKSPDFSGTRFVDPFDFVANNPYPLDREGHGTFVAGTIAETTNNRYGLTGLAYGASIMPIRVLDSDGTGDSATIARGIRYAVAHGAQVINLSLEFSLDVSSGDIPDIISAIRYAHARGAVVVAAAGNEGVDQLAYPARSTPAISVGATTADRCLGDYSNGGPGLDLVAPGGGNDSSLLADPDCHPDRQLPTISQMTFLNPARPWRFGYPEGVYGTSMATPHVAAVAALVIASGVLGRHPTPNQVLLRLEQTAQHLGSTTPNANYGYGLVDAGAATTPFVATPAPIIPTPAPAP